MADYSALKATIDASINTNGQQAITGAILNDVLNEMVDVLGEGYTFLGVATPTTNPTTPEGKAYYLAGAAGTYSNFGNIVVNDDEVALLVWNGTAWSKVVTEAASKEEVRQLSQELNGINEVLLDNVTTEPGKIYISADMVSPGDELVFDLTSLNNLQGLLKAEKTDYVHDAYINCPAGQSVTRTYVVPEGFFRIYTASGYNPMVVTCRIVKAGKIQNLEDDVQNLSDNLDALSESALKETDLLSDAGSSTSKGMTQKAITNLTDSPFAVVVPDALKGIVAFRMNNVAGNNMPIDDYTSWRIASIYTGGAWNLYLALQKSVDGVNWTPFDSVERAASAAPSPLPVIEEITSKYGGFSVIINWPMMGTASLSGVSYILKKTSPNYYVRKLQEQTNVILNRENIGITDYELHDRTRQIVKVDINGNGDYTSIATAYAAITDSSYDNQYEVVVYPGTYNEYNLIPPKFTHTHGLIPNSVIVTSEGVSSTLPVFDQRVPCKLSNMKIVSGTGYCVHQDQSSLNGIVLVNENLHCKKVYGQDVRNFGFRSLTNPAVLGIGSHLYGAKFVWENCIFEDGQVASHTVGGNATIPANQHLIYRNCKLVNAYVHLLVAGASSKVGNFVCEIDGLHTEKGRPSLVCKLGTRSSGDTTYNFPWQVIGGGNRDFIVITQNVDDTETPDVWPNINTNDINLVQLASGVSVTKGQFVDIAGNVCDASTPAENVIGMAIEDAEAGASVRVCAGSFALSNIFLSVVFPYTTYDGDYGIGADGRLLKDATIKIGFVKFNNFYRV